MKSDRKKTKKIRWLGITNAAQRLGVSRTHLYLVLTGKRISKSLENTPEVKAIRAIARKIA